MKTVAEYRKHAEECEALARRAKSAEEREMIANMASTWRLLADQREKMILKRLEGPVAQFGIQTELPPLPGR
jgi:hypothetical protein